MTPVHFRLARAVLAGAVAVGGLVATAAPGHAATACTPTQQAEALAPCGSGTGDRPGSAAAAANSPHEALLLSLAEVVDTYLSEGLLRELTGSQAPISQAPIG